MPPTNTSKKRTVNDNELPYVFNLCVRKYLEYKGSYDHFTVRCNLPKDDVVEAHKAGSQKCGFNLKEDMTKTGLDAEQITELKEAGIQFDNLTDVQEDEEEMIFGSQSYSELWLEIAKLGNPDLKWQIEKVDIYIGGEAFAEC